MIGRLNDTFHTAIEAFSHCVKRFPATVGFILASTVYLMYLVESEFHGDEKGLLVVGYYLSMGVLLSLSMHLWGEEWKDGRRAAYVHIAMQVLLAADALFLYHATGSVEIWIAHGAGVLALGASVFFLSFLKEKSDVAAWNFMIRGVIIWIVTDAVGLVMTGGICLLIYSVKLLFGIEIAASWYLHTLVLFAVMLPKLLLLGLLPHGKLKHDRQAVASGFQEGIIRYLFLPLTGGYLAVLYLYAGRILLAWELPTGWVSWLVTVLMFGCIMLECGLYSLRQVHRKQWEERVARWLPVLVLPLLLLMTVGIVRRLNDYGITINRLYLVTLNIWFYFVCIGLAVTKAKRISWIPVSFSLLFLLTSVFPVNYASITRQVLQSEIRAVWKQSGQGDLPLSQERYDAWLKSLPEEQGRQVDEKLLYLRDWFGKRGINSFLDETVNVRTTVLEVGEEERFWLTASSATKHTIEVPRGCSNFFTHDTWDAEVTQKDMKEGVLTLPLVAWEDSVQLSVDSLRAKADLPYGELEPMALRSKSGKHVLVLTSFTLHGSDSNAILNVEGYLFHDKSSTN